MKTYLQYETEYQYVIVETEKLHHPIGKPETVYRIRCGVDHKAVLNKKDIEPFIIATYGNIIAKRTIKY